MTLSKSTTGSENPPIIWVFLVFAIWVFLKVQWVFWSFFKISLGIFQSKLLFGYFWGFYLGIFWVFLATLMGIFWVFIGYFLGIFQQVFWVFLGISGYFLVFLFVMKRAVYLSRFLKKIVDMFCEILCFADHFQWFSTVFVGYCS